MKMKKILSSLTAGVMAATTILPSALITPVMSLTASAGTTGDCYLFARDEHWALGGDNYDRFATQISNITGDGRGRAVVLSHRNGYNLGFESLLHPRAVRYRNHKEHRFLWIR